MIPGQVMWLQPTPLGIIVIYWHNYVYICDLVSVVTGTYTSLSSGDLLFDTCVQKTKKLQLGVCECAYILWHSLLSVIAELFYAALPTCNVK